MSDARSVVSQYLELQCPFSARTAPAHVLFLYMANDIWHARMTHNLLVLWLMAKLCSETHAALLNFHYCHREHSLVLNGFRVTVCLLLSLVLCCSFHADLWNWVELLCCNTVDLIIGTYKLENTSCSVFHLTLFIHRWLLSGFFTLSLRWEENQIFRLNTNFCCFIYNSLLSDISVSDNS